MSNLTGMNMKYVVLKNEDIDMLPTEYIIDLQYIVKCINDMRERDNKYIVINTDEPYIDEVIAILKRHGHWG